ADRGRSETAFLHHSGLKKSFDDAENIAVGHFRRQSCHDNRVRDVVEEPLNVGVEYISVPLPMEFDHPCHGHVAVPLGPEAIGVVMKDPLEERTQELATDLLSNSVADCGDSQGTGFAVAFGDVNATQRAGLKSPVL